MKVIFRSFLNLSAFILVIGFLGLNLAFAATDYSISGSATFGTTALTNSYGTAIEFVGSGGTYGYAYPDASGSYSATGLPNDSYNLELSTPQGGGSSSLVPYISNLTTTNNPITVDNSNVTQNIALPSANLTVTVLDSSGNPVPSGTNVDAYSNAGGSVTDQSGTMQFASLTSQQITDNQHTNSSGVAVVPLVPGT
jgi:hypothetical protein